MLCTRSSSEQSRDEPRRSVITAVGGSTAAELANLLLEPGASPLIPDSDDQLLALAWAFKDLCYAAWSSEPQRAARGAEMLRDLVEQYRVHRQSRERASETAGNDPLVEVAAVADWTMGIAHLTRGEMAPAIDRFNTAARGFHSVGDADHAAQTQVPKIMALSMLGRYADATACANQAGQVFKRLGDARSAGKVSLNLSALHERLGAYAEAAQESRSAAVLFARVGDRELSIMADINAGNALSALGDFDEALCIYDRAKMRAENRGYPVLEALAEESVALVRLAQGQYREALAGLEHSRRRYETLDMPQHLATAEKQLGDSYLELRLLPEAAALFEQAIKRFEALDFPDEQAWTCVQLGRVQALRGHPAEAATSFERAADLFVQLGSDVAEATVTLARAELMLSGGESAGALDLAGKAADGFDRANLVEGRLRADIVKAHGLMSSGEVELANTLFTTTLERAREMRLLTLQVRCLTGQGLAARAQGNLRVAESVLGEAIDLFEVQRRALPGDELRTAFLSDHMQPYQALLSMAIETQKASPTPDGAARVLMLLDRARARSLGERLGHVPTRIDDEPTQSLRDRLAWLYHQIQRKEEEGESVPVLAQEMRSVEKQLLEQTRRARIAERSNVASAAGQDSVLTPGSKLEDLNVGALQELMGNADGLVEYGVDGDALFACVLTRTGVSLHHDIAPWSEVRDTVAAVRFQIEALSHGAPPLHQHMETLTRRALVRLQQLYGLVWAPFARTLEKCHRVLIVPHGQLAALPFAALHDGSVALAERFELAVVPSARLAIRGYRRQPLPSHKLLVLGESRRLPYAEKEAEFVGGLFDEAEVFIGDKATLSAVQRHAGQADVLHLACHAQFRTDNPMFSALHLSDGPLTVERAETLDLRPGLVVLSACETGSSELGIGDEMVGLVRGFLLAGTARVLATSWPIDDEHAARFMTGFYQARCRGVSPARALRQAQLVARRDTPHPFYWAAFTLYGGF